MSGMAAIDPHSLAKALDRSGMTQKQLADELGISLSYLSRILAGTRRLKRNPILRLRIAEALDVPIHWIEARSNNEAA